MVTEPAVNKAPEYVEGEILVKFKPKTIELVYENDLTSTTVKAMSPSIENLKKKHKVYKIEQVVKPRPPKKGRMVIQGMAVEEEDNLSRIYKLSFPTRESFTGVLSDFRNDPNVEYAEPNYIRKVYAPNDPKYIDNTQWGPQKIKLTPTGSGSSGWDFSKGSSEVVICILDTGVDYNHPDLAANIWVNSPEDINSSGSFEATSEAYGGDLDGIDNDGNGYTDDVIGYDFVTASPVYPGEDGDPPDPNPMDFYGHGTHCSGIASAVTNNGIGMSGVGWNCKIMAVRGGFTGTDGGGYLFDSDIIAGLHYAAIMGADVISMSFGGSESAEADLDAINYAHNAGCVLVAAAGNGYSDEKSYPADYDNVIAVVATNSNDTKANFSNYGDWVDVCAPGVSIYSTLYSGVFSPKFTRTYASWSGTSMATPHVAGLAGLIKALHPSWNNDTIRVRIESTCDNIDSLNPGYAGLLGHGRINAFRALYPGPLLQTLKLSDRHSGSTSLATDRIISVEAVGASGDPSEEIISENSDFSGASWQAFRNPATFELSIGDENKTVYYKMRDASLNLSPTYEASIILDIVSPEISHIVLRDRTKGDTLYTNERYISAEAYISKDNLISIMISEDASFSGASWMPAAATFEYYLSSPGEGTKEVFYKVRDIASRETNVTSESIILDTTIIGVTSIEVRDPFFKNAKYTNKRTIEVEAYNVIGTPESTRISEEATFAGAGWMPYFNPTTFEIFTVGDGTKRVYYNLKDAGGVTSETVSDMITLDTLKPSVATNEPYSNASNVRITQRILITFNDTMEGATVTLEVSPPLTLGSPTWSAGSKTVAYYPPNRLAFDSTYTITVEGGARDKAGNELGPYSWNFTTAAQSTIEGTIMWETTPLSGISVEFEDSQRNFIGAATTNSMGKFTMNALADETYRVEPLAGGYEISTETIILSTGDKKSADFNLSKAWPSFHLNRGKTGASPDTVIEPTLKFKWSYKFSDVNWQLWLGSSSPVVAYGNVYIGSYDYQKVFCLSEETGAFKWSYDLGDETGKCLTVANNSVYVYARQTQTIHTLDAGTGAFKWSLFTPGWLNGPGPAYSNGNLYFIARGVANSQLYRLNAQTGEIIWQKPTSLSESSPTVKDGICYVVSSAYHQILAHDTKTGNLLWVFLPPSTNADWVSDAAVSAGNIFVTGYDGYLYSANAKTGSPNWSYYAGYSLYGTPAISDGTVYFGNSNIFAADEFSGSFKWSRYLPSGTACSPASANGTLYFGTGDYFMGLDTATGTIKWSYSVATPEVYDPARYSSPAIVNGTLFSSTKTGDLIAFKPNQTPNDPTSLVQLQYLGGALIPTGGDSDLSRAVLKFSMSDPDPYGTLYPEVEIRPVSEVFTGTQNFTGAAVDHLSSPVTGTVTVEGLTNFEDYHWQARTKDEYGRPSGWVTYNSGNKAFRAYDIVSPEVILTIPAANETKVSNFTKITILFSEPMSKESVISAFKIYPATGGSFEVLQSGVTYESFKPSSRLSGKTVYLITLEGSALDEAGNPLSLDHTFTFETSAGRISGFVTIPGFGGAVGAYVEVSKNGSTKVSAVTNSIGFYLIDNLPEDSFTVQALLSGYSIGTRYNVAISAESTTTANFTLGTAWPVSLLDRGNSKLRSDPALSPPLKLKWSFRTGAGIGFSNSSVIENGKVFAMDDYGKLCAVNISNGALLWSKNVPYSYEFNPPSASDNMVYIITSRNPNPSPPPTYGIKLFAFNQSNGSISWSCFVPGTDTSTGPVINNGYLYVGAYNYLDCFDLQNHTLAWSYDTGIWMSATPCIYNNHIYLATWNDLQAIDLETGTLKWSTNIETSGYVGSSPSISDGTLYVGNNTGTLFSVNPSTGGIIWSYSQSDPIQLSPLAAEGNVYFGAGEYLYAVDRSSGGFLWSSDIGQISYTSPVMINGTIYIGATDPDTALDKVLAINPSNGQILWSYDTGDYLYSTFSGSNGTLVFGEGYKGLFAFVSSSEAQTTAPVITSGPQAENIGTDEATIIWQTDEPANSIVEWGFTQSYGDLVSSAAFVTDHLVTLEGLLDNITYNYRVGSKDELGNGPTWSSNHTFLTGMIAGKDYTNPQISVLVNGSRITRWDIINPMPEITATLTDNTTVDVSSVKLYIDNITAEGAAITVIDAPRSYTLRYKVPSPLEPETIRRHTIFLSVKDVLGNLSFWEAGDLRVISGPAKIMGEPLSYPEVFKPLSGNPVTIAYNLTADVDTTIFIYDISGNIVLTRKFRAGQAGGRAGYNGISWNGKTDFGQIVGNGIYIYKITSGKKVLGAGKLVVYD